jgi:capsular exopolysaccharide synthesis family protein
MLLIGLALGSILGVGLAFLLSYLDNSLRTPEDVQRTMGLPSLGVIPSFSSEKQLSAELLDRDEREISPDPTLPAVRETLSPIVYLSNPRSLAAEAYRTIRTGILLSQAGSPPRVILVSSAQSSEGKTTTTVNLAASLASTGGSVVIIDADLRRPSLMRHLKIENDRPGLVELLTGLCEIDEVIFREQLPGVSIILSGRIPPNPAELLGSTEMENLVDRLAGQFDYVLIDSPPILPVTDSVILSRFVDGVVFVVKGGSTPRKVARDAKNRLLNVGARLLGVILNDVDVTNGDYYYYNRYYYAYYKGEDRSERDGKRAVGT